ncbi:hypothetical protein [Thermococcus litoralis]|uniref:hypothetical protein n=1 Tax=Thermococcus litoralis TaxID=2265 RepID=UPI00211B3AA6|nr:hypothetical protein [Thermococcus litoralis]
MRELAMDSLDIKFTALFFIILILLGVYVVDATKGFSLSKGKAKIQNVPPYVYTTEEIEKMKMTYSLTNFSGLTTDSILIAEANSIALNLNQSKCEISEISKDFYTYKIHTFVPTVAYLHYDMIKCKRELGDINLARTKLEDLLAEMNKTEYMMGQSPWMAIGELYVQWELAEYEANATTTKAAFDLNALVPFLQRYVNRRDSKYKKINFDLQNITRTQEELKELEKSMREKKDLREDLIGLGLGWLNLSESAFYKGEKSLSLWYYSVALAYLKLAETRWAEVPQPYYGAYQTKADVPYNITGLREEVYERALRIMHKNNNGPYAELLSTYVLLELNRLDNHNLEKLSDSTNPFLKHYPYIIYHRYLEVLAMTVAIEIFSSYFS